LYHVLCSEKLATCVSTLDTVIHAKPPNPKPHTAVETYYSAICDWFHEVLPKEGILIDVIDSAILEISPNGKECIIKANEREFRSFFSYK